MAECKFCGDDAKLTDEHGWPETALNRVRTKVGGGDHRIWTPTPDGDTRIWTGEKPALKAKITCPTCNHERLHGIERAAERVVMPLIDGIPRYIPKGREQLVLARWAVRCSMVLEFTIDDPSPHFSLEQRKGLAFNGTIPNGAFIGLGVFGEARPSAWYRPVHLPPLEGFPYDLLVSTFSIGQLVVQVIAFDDDAGVPTQLVTDPPRTLKRLWPPPELNIRWPPRWGLDYAGLHELSNFLLPQDSFPPPTRPPAPTPSRRRDRERQRRERQQKRHQ